MNRKNPLWTASAKADLRSDARCSAIASLALTKLNGSPLPDRSLLEKANGERIELGLKIIKNYKKEDSALKNLWNRINPKKYYPNEDNYAYLELQKHLYSLFQYEDQHLLESMVANQNKEALEVLTLKDADRLRATTSYYLQAYGKYQPLSILEVLILLLKVNNYDIYKTFGHLGWVHYRDVMIADGVGGYSNRAKNVVISKYTKPILINEDDPAGQAYHFWGYASRRLGQGKLVGDNVANLASYYYEQFQSVDDEDHYTDMAGIYFADYFAERYFYYKSHTLDTLSQIFKSESCFKYNLHNFKIFEDSPPSAKCLVSINKNSLKDPIRSHLIFGSVYSEETKKEQVEKCRGLAAMALNTNIARANVTAKPRSVYFGLEIFDPNFKEPVEIRQLTYKDIESIVVTR